VDWVNGHYVHLVTGAHKGMGQYSDYCLI